jgi:hypothetical protein
VPLEGEVPLPVGIGPPPLIINDEDFCFSDGEGTRAVGGIAEGSGVVFSRVAVARAVDRDSAYVSVAVVIYSCFGVVDSSEIDGSCS